MTDDRQYEVLYTSDPGKRGNGLFIRPVGNRSALLEIVSEQAGLDPDGAEVLLDDLRASGRYQRDVY